MDTTKQIADLQRQIDEMKALVGILTNAADINPDVQVSLQLKLGTLVAQTSKAANSENQSVNESGSLSYSVLKAPDGFDKRTDNGTTKYYPFYT